MPLLLHLLTSHYLPLREQAVGSRACTSWISEHSDEAPPFQFSERFLQIVWNEQRLRGDLRTVDGRAVEVLAPGTWNVEAGPDFRSAVVRLDGQTRSGDVEVHRAAADWWSHGHHQDPLYRNVILHVVWESERSIPGAPPTLVVRQALDAPLGELSLWLDGSHLLFLPSLLSGDSAFPVRKLPFKETFFPAEFHKFGIFSRSGNFYKFR